MAFFWYNRRGCRVLVGDPALGLRRCGGTPRKMIQWDPPMAVCVSHLHAPLEKPENGYMLKRELDEGGAVRETFHPVPGRTRTRTGAEVLVAFAPSLIALGVVLAVVLFRLFVRSAQ